MATDPRLPAQAYQRRPTLPGRQDALIGPTPPPTASERFIWPRDQSAAMEEAFIEALAMRDDRLVDRIAARLTKQSGAQVSAEMTMWQTRARRRGMLAGALGTALGVATTIFVSGWAVIDRYRAQTTREATEAATSAVAPTITPAVAPLATRLDIAEDRLDALDARLQRVEDGISRMLELLQPEDETQPRRRIR